MKLSLKISSCFVTSATKSCWNMVCEIWIEVKLPRADYAKRYIRYDAGVEWMNRQFLHFDEAETDLWVDIVKFA